MKMLLTTSLLARGQLLQTLLSKYRPIFTNIKDNGAVRSASRTLEEKVGLPPRPKKPLTPYFRFMLQSRPEVVKENPNLNARDVIRLISKRWGTADTKLKQRLEEEFKNDKQKYVEVRAKYDAKITDEQRIEMKQIKQSVIDSRERQVMRKRLRELGRPKKPASAFLRFVAAERINSPQLSTQTYREWHKKVVAKWARMSDEEKNRFVLDARTEMETYKKDILAWEDKMIKLGHIDVVRQTNLIEPVTTAETKTKKKH